MEMEKEVITTMQGGDRRAAVEAMHELLERLRALPDWCNRENGLVLQLPNGDLVEVRGQSGEFEALVIEVKPKAG